MSNSPVITNVAVAPTMGAQGHATRGGHHHAYMACRRFGLSETLKLVSTVNPWRPGTSGSDFYIAALQGGKSATVQAAVEAGGKIGLKPREVINHLRWLYTWGGSYLEVSGKLYAAPVAVEPAAPTPAPTAPAAAAPAPKAAPKAKAKAKA